MHLCATRAFYPTIVLPNLNLTLVALTNISFSPFLDKDALVKPVSMTDKGIDPVNLPVKINSAKSRPISSCVFLSFVCLFID